MLLVDVLQKKKETIVQRSILPNETHPDGKVDRINNLAQSNKHYVNISIMLGKMHGCTESFTLKTNPVTRLYFCSETTCTNTILSYYSRLKTEPICRQCLATMNNEARRSKRKDNSTVDGT